MKFQRIGDTARVSLGFDTNLERQGSLLTGVRGSPRQEARSISAAVSGRRTQERGSSRSSERPPMEDLPCETCWQKLEPHQQMVQCSGCGKWTHENCQEQLDIGMRWHAVMCLMCKNKVTHWLRIVAAAEKRRFRSWNEDDWFRSLLGQVAHGLRLVQTPNEDLNRLEYFLATALDARLNYWEHPRAVISPTEVPASPHFQAREGSVQRAAEPPGLPTPKAEPEVPPEFMQQGAVSSSRPAAGYRI